MQYIIAVFKNRTECYSFLSIMKSYTNSAHIINTPKEINMPCGISVAFKLNNFNDAKYILSRRHFSSFSGFYKILQTSTTLRILPAYF